MTHAHQHRHHHVHPHALESQDWGDRGGFLELESEVFAGVTDGALAMLQRVAPAGVVRIADVGCGVGTTSTALASAFPHAQVLALDVSPPLLEQVRSRAHRLGLGPRVRTVTGDLEALGDVLNGMELVWAGMVLHHIAPLARVLRELHTALAMGGVLALLEFGPPTRILPQELGFGAPGFTRRHEELMAAALAAHLPPGATQLDWPGLLGAAGFELVKSSTLLVNAPKPLTARTRQWVLQRLLGSMKMLDGRLSKEDLATLAILTDPDDVRGVMRSMDCELHAGRTLWLARKS